MSEVKTSADTCTVLLWPAVWAPAPVLDLCPHWGQEESPEEPDWSQYEVMHCLQNQCPQLVETGSFRTSWHEAQQDDCSSSGTWLLLFLFLWRHFLITHMSQSQVVITSVKEVLFSLCMFVCWLVCSDYKTPLNRLPVNLVEGCGLWTKSGGMGVVFSVDPNKKKEAVS